MDRFEEDLARYVGAKRAVATVNGTSALHVALLIAGVEPDDEVLTSSLTFIAPAKCRAVCVRLACLHGPLSPSIGRWMLRKSWIFWKKNASGVTRPCTTRIPVVGSGHFYRCIYWDIPWTWTP